MFLAVTRNGINIEDTYAPLSRQCKEDTATGGFSAAIQSLTKDRSRLQAGAMHQVHGCLCMASSAKPATRTSAPWKNMPAARAIFCLRGRVSQPPTRQRPL